jgi:AhpD family alkylhydroperoxidase
LIDLHVSQLNGCGYCVSAHTVFAKANKISDSEILRIRDGQGETPRDAAVLALARRVAKSGGLGAVAEIAQAREAGLSDPQIVEVIAAAALRSLVNAVAQAAGTEIDWPIAPRIPEA